MSPGRSTDALRAPSAVASLTSEDADRTPSRSIAGQIAAFTFVAFVFGFTFGVTAAGAGLTVIKTLGLSFMFAGAAQFTVVAIVMVGGPVSAAIAAAMLLNARFGMLALAVAHRIPMSMGRRFVAALVLGDPPVVMAIAERTPRRRERVYWLTALITATGWLSGTVVGALAEGGISDPNAIGLDAALPALMLAILGQHFRDRPNLLAAGCGAVIGVALVPITPAGLPVLAGGLGALVPLLLFRSSIAATAGPSDEAGERGLA
jgi:predicted branched-subunit amino acid permease